MPTAGGGEWCILLEVKANMRGLCKMTARAWSKQLTNHGTNKLASRHHTMNQSQHE